jgi:hypothetical protein
MKVIRYIVLGFYLIIYKFIHYLYNLYELYEI